MPWNGTEDVDGWNTSDQNASNDTTDGENLSSADESEAATCQVERRDHVVNPMFLCDELFDTNLIQLECMAPSVPG